MTTTFPPGARVALIGNDNDRGRVVRHQPGRYSLAKVAFDDGTYCLVRADTLRPEEQP